MSLGSSLHGHWYDATRMLSPPRARYLTSAACVGLLLLGESALRGDPWTHLVDASVAAGFLASAVVWSGRAARAVPSVTALLAGASWCVAGVDPRVSAAWWPGLAIAVSNASRERRSWAARLAVALLGAAAVGRGIGANRPTEALALAGAAALFLVTAAVSGRQHGGDAHPAGPPGSTVPRLLVGLGIAVPVLVAAIDPVAWAQIATVAGSALLAAAGGWLFVVACTDNGPGVDIADRVVELATMPGATGIPGLAVVDEAASAPKAYAAALAMLEANRVLVAQLDLQVAQSRALQWRLVTAADTERQQLAARLGASLLPLLDELIMTLRRIEDGAAGHAVQAAAREALGEVDHAVEDLQRIARGLHPRLVSDAGLRVALKDLAARSPINVVVSAPGGRYPSAVEATLWYVCAEALTNAIKHAHATRVTVDIQTAARALVARVGDDGRLTRTVDLAYADGGGLSGVRDRVLACGGSLVLLTRPSGGVVVEVRVPW